LFHPDPNEDFTQSHQGERINWPSVFLHQQRPKPHHSISFSQTQGFGRYTSDHGPRRHVLYYNGSGSDHGPFSNSQTLAYCGTNADVSSNPNLHTTRQLRTSRYVGMITHHTIMFDDSASVDYDIAP